VHRNPSWYLRIFEIDGRASKGARVLDFGNQCPDSRHLVCGVRGVTERASTQDPKGSGRLVALARAFIAKKACEDSALNQDLIAAHLGVSVRTLQLRFKESKFERTILQEIHHARLSRVRWLLVHSDKPISDITYLAGFRSQSRLKALFQKQFGTSMSDYRKRALPTHYEVTFTIPVIFGIIVAS